MGADKDRAEMGIEIRPCRNSLHGVLDYENDVQTLTFLEAIYENTDCRRV
jgi:hypothetical protein